MLYDLRHQMTLASLPCFFHISYLALFPIYHFPQICISTPPETDFLSLEETVVLSVMTTWVEKWGTETLQSYQNALHLWHWWNSDHRSTARCFHCWLLELILALVLLANCYYQTFSTIASTAASIASSTATLTANIDTTITTQLEPLEFRRQSILWMPSIVRG